MKIGIDLGGSHIAVGVITKEGKLLAKQDQNEIITNQENITQWVRDRILSLIHCVLRELQIPIFVIEEIGIGVPGIVKDNQIESIRKYGIGKWDLAKELEEHYQIPVRIQNDALCSAKAEKQYGNLREVQRAVFLCLGTGIGGVTLIEDTILPSEYGHMVIEKGGRTCHCGKKGCFETYSSMQAFKKEMIEKMNLSLNTTSEELLAILQKEKQNEELNYYIDNYIQTLLTGISNIVNIINPERICIGGSFTYFEDILYKRLLEKALTTTYQFEKPEIVLAKLQNTAGIIGATL